MNELFTTDLNVVNVGLASFAENLAHAGGQSVPLAWRTPAGVDIQTGLTLAALVNDPVVNEANQVALRRYLEAQPVLVDVVLARDAMATLADARLILHAGPPIPWAEMCGPVQGAIAGALVYERWAATPDQAMALASSGAVAFEPAHDHGAVGPMAGIISPSMPVWVVENTAAGNRAFCTFNEGLGKVLCFGANSPAVIEHLRWMGTELHQVVKAGVQRMGGLELKPLMAQALMMGDEVHNRNGAATGLFFKKLVPALLAAEIPTDRPSRVVDFVAGNDHFFLNLSMASCKAMLDDALGATRALEVWG